MYGINPPQEKALTESQVVSQGGSLTVSKELQSGQKAHLIIHYPIFGIPITASVKDPNGIVVWTSILLHMTENCMLLFNLVLMENTL